MTGSEKITFPVAGDPDFSTPADRAEENSVVSKMMEKEAFNYDLRVLDATVGIHGFKNLTDGETTNHVDFSTLFNSSEDFKLLMEDTGYAEYLIPFADVSLMEDSENDSDLSLDSDISIVDQEKNLSGANTLENNFVTEHLDVGDITVEQLHATIAEQFEKRAQEIKDKVDPKKNVEVFKRHIFEYRRFVARQEHLKLSPEVIRRRVFDFALFRANRCDDECISIAWAYVLCNYTDVMGPDLLFLSECYTAVDGLLVAFEKFTFFGY